MELRNDGSLQVQNRTQDPLLLGPPASPAHFVYRDGKYKMVLPGGNGIAEWFECVRMCWAVLFA